jgi:hypothetical protein
MFGLEDGRTLEGAIAATHRFKIPVYDRVWNGSRVGVELSGATLEGCANDWMPEQQPYDRGVS